MQKWKKYILASDIIALYLALVLALIVRGLIYSHVVQNESVWIAAHVVIFLPSVIISILALYISGLYEAKTIFDKSKTIVLLFYTQFSAALFTVLTFYFIKTDLTPKLTLFLYVIISIIILSITRSFIFNSLQRLNKHKAIFLGEDENLFEKLTPAYGPFTFTKAASLEALKKQIKNSFTGVVYDKNKIDVETLVYLEELKSRNVLVYSYDQYFEYLYKKVDLDYTDMKNLMLEIGEKKETRGHFMFRKFLDISSGLLLLPFYLLTLPFVYLGIYFQDKGNINSLQDRVSFLGKRVWIYKIRTMTATDVGGIVGDSKDKNEKSKFGNVVTPFGKFLRKTRIDELPQCLNLIRGDVSLIGPRADIIGVHEDMKAHIDNYKLRLLVPQGLTGWAQVHMNFPPRTHSEHRERLAYELFYIKNRSIFLDVSIILKTIKTLLSREGA